MQRETDVVVIGAGTAGINAVRACAEAGSDWLLVESGPYGTTCARVGCMPSKLVIAAADRARSVASAPEFGIEVKGCTVDAGAVFDRVRTERDRFVDGILEQMDALPDDRKIRGRARFVDRTRIAVDTDDGSGCEIACRAVVIATGAAPVLPPGFDRQLDHIWVSDDVFELRHLPESLAVVGIGAVGLELGQALGALGVEVTFFSNGGEVGPLRDPALQRAALDLLTRQHAVHLHVDIDEVHEGEKGCELRWRDRRGQRHSKVFSRVLVAAGRKPQVSGLCLERAGIELDDDSKLPAPWNPETAQCGGAPIFLAGDVSNRRPVLHEAADEGRIAGYNAAHYPDVTRMTRRAPLSIVFSHPQMAQVGAAVTDRLEEGVIVSGSASFDHQGRASIIGENAGSLKLMFSSSSAQLLGAELLGPSVEHLAHLLAWAVQRNLTAPELFMLPFYHPVLEESLRTAVRDAISQARLEGECATSAFAMCAGP